MSRLEVLGETQDAVVIRVHADPRGGDAPRRAACVVYVAASSSPATVAGQLRCVADGIELRAQARRAAGLV